MGADSQLDFAKLLRRYRRAACLTQEELAARAELSKRGISDLERGARTRPYRHTVQLLADALGLSPAERVAIESAARTARLEEGSIGKERQQYPAGNGQKANEEAAMRRLEALPNKEIPQRAPLPAGSRMPLNPNPLFVGRESELRELADLLKAGSTTAVSPVAATGIGGTGKTQLATEFVHRYGQYFAGGVYWLSFANPAMIPVEVAECGDLRQYPYLSGLPLEDQMRHTLSEWQSPLPRLLVFDNCENEALLDQWRPSTGGARVLITSRRGLWNAGLGVRVLALDGLSDRASVALLRQHRPDLSPESPDLRAIAAQLGNLPLALDLAGRFLARYRAVVTPPAYLAHLRGPDLLKHRSLTGKVALSTRHELSVGHTFALSYDRLDPADPTDALARAMLTCAAYLAPGEPIPREWLLALATPDPDLGDADAPFRAEDALHRLVELGLMERQANQTLRLHRLLGMFVLSISSDATAHELAEELVVRVARGLREAGHRMQYAMIQPHLRAVVDRALEEQRDDELAAVLYTELGLLLSDLGSYAEARLYLERALRTIQRAPNPHPLNVAYGHNNLAMILEKLGDHVGARPMYESALAICEESLPTEYLAAANISHNLALLLLKYKEYRAVKPLLERALVIRERELGPEHPNTVDTLNALAGLLCETGNYEDALALFEQVLEIRKKVLGPNHPATATVLSNIGSLFETQGLSAQQTVTYAGSLAPLQRRHLLSGPNVAQVIRLRVFSPRAKDSYEQALGIRERELGPEHPDTVDTLSALAGLLYKSGDYEDALPLFEQVLEIRERAAWPDYLALVAAQLNLAGLLYWMHKYDYARSLYEQASINGERELGPEHPHTVLARKSLAAMG